MVYVASMDGYLYAITYEGKLLWKYHLGDHSYSAPAVKGNGIFAASINGTVHAVSPEGKRLWTFKAGDEIGTGISVFSNKLIFGSYDEHIYCLDLDGNLDWKFRTGGPCSTFGLPSKSTRNLLFAPSWNMWLYALTSRGELKWKYNMGDFPFYHIFDDKIFFSRNDGQIHCIGNDGKELDKFKVASSRLGGMAMHEGTIYTTCTDGYLMAIRDGVVIRKEYLGDFLIELIIDNGTIYAGGHLCYFYAINAKDLSIKWKFTTSNPRPAEWRKIGFSPVIEKEENIIYEKESREIILKTTRYGNKPQEQEFRGTYSPGATTYFADSPYSTTMKYGKKTEYTDNKS